MAEKTILVCDMCGRPATETVTIRLDRGNFVKDLCNSHISEMIAGARRPRRGRRKAVVAAAAPVRKSVGRKAAGRKTSAKRVGRPRKKTTGTRTKAAKG